jgi:hypothetical protein
MACRSPSYTEHIASRSPSKLRLASPARTQEQNETISRLDSPAQTSNKLRLMQGLLEYTGGGGMRDALAIIDAKFTQLRINNENLHCLMNFAFADAPWPFPNVFCFNSMEYAFLVFSDQRHKYMIHRLHAFDGRRC